MCAFDAGQKLAVSSRVRVARAVALAAMLALPGCASENSTYSAAGGPSPTRVAGAVIEVEDDGLPAQTPPSARLRQMPDDPSQPFSRNYGGVNPSREPLHENQQPQPVHAPTPVIPKDLPPQFRKQLAEAIAAREDE